MKYQWTVITIGIAVIAFPLLHLPVSWEITLHVFLGILLILTGVGIQQSRARTIKKAPIKKEVIKEREESEEAHEEIIV